MKIILISIVVIIVGFISCSDKQQETVIKNDSVEKMTIKNDTAVTVRKEITTENGNQFIIIESKPSISVSNYMIAGKGFKNSADTLKFPLKNPMSAALLADLDKNGFEELYIITKSAGSQTFVDMFAIASNPDSSFNEIKIEQINAEDVNDKNGKFHGYMGFDSIYISDNRIIREFPVFQSSDLSEETREMRRIFYQLKPYDKFNELVISGLEKVNK